MRSAMLSVGAKMVWPKPLPHWDAMINQLLDEDRFKAITVESMLKRTSDSAALDSIRVDVATGSGPSPPISRPVSALAAIIDTSTANANAANAGASADADADGSGSYDPTAITGESTPTTTISTPPAASGSPTSNFPEGRPKPPGRAYTASPTNA
jgi:hypothetical protein